MKIWFLIGGLLTAAVASAQQPHQHQPAQPSTQTGSEVQPGVRPYADMATRSIKALSDQQIADLRAGRGMSLALPAELNGYPGPSHALQLAAPLSLSDEQTLATRRLFGQMQVEAIDLGDRIIAAEVELDGLFKDRKATAETIAAATAKVARAFGQLRAAHLQYHLEMIAVLTPAQVVKYNQLRGYH